MSAQTIIIGQRYSETELEMLLPHINWNWWFGIEGTLLVGKDGYQFSFAVDYRRNEPFLLRGLSKGTYGNWRHIEFETFNLETMKATDGGKSEK